MMFVCLSYHTRAVCLRFCGAEKRSCLTTCFLWMLIDEKPCWMRLLRWDEASRVPCLKKERLGALHVAKGGYVSHQRPASTVSCFLPDLHCSRISFDCSTLFWTFFSLLFPLSLPLLPFDFFL